jgi:cytochrome c oxidase assembly factor CtaG
MDISQNGNFWASWALAPQITLPLLLGEYLYLRATLHRKEDQARKERGFFLAGLASIALVVVTPIGVHSGQYFWCHMVQHITLMMVAGPLLVLGTPMNFHPQNKIFQALTNPVSSWIVYATIMVGVHLPAPHVFIMQRPWLHNYVEIPLYFTVSYLFYYNLLDRNQSGRRISPAMSVIALFLMMVPETLTGFFIYVTPHSLYQGMFTLNDQRRGGSIMWSGGMIIDAIWIAFAVFHWIKSEERASIAIDAEIAAEQVQK